MEEILTKKCSKCGVERPLIEYHKNGFDTHGNQNIVAIVNFVQMN